MTHEETKETWSIKDVADTFERHGLITEQEQKYCDRNICLRNEYNGIGCDECEVQEPCEDAISRQAVQDYIAKYLSQYLYNDVREAVEVIDEYIGELPSVKPQPICEEREKGECPYYAG